jgi:hypothetical protein
MYTTLVGGPLDGQLVEVDDRLPTAISVPIMNGTQAISVNPFMPPVSASYSTILYRIAAYKPGKNKPNEYRYVFGEIYKTLVEGKKK